MENSSIVKKAMDYIRDEACKSDMTIEDVASNVGFSTNYFNSIFAAHTGFNVMEYVRFIRLKNAAILLRKTDRDVLDIALECGYQAHESFTRAFKKQYGMTPSEYRERKGWNHFFEDFRNETVCARITHEFPQLKMADRDEVADYLLEKDSVRYGWIALNFLSLAHVPFYLSDDLSRGIVYICESPNGFNCCIISDDYDEIAEYARMFENERFYLQVYTADTADNVTQELLKRGVNKSVEPFLYRKVYTGEPFQFDLPEGIGMRELTRSDMDDIRRVCERIGIGMSKTLETFFTDSFENNVVSPDKSGRWMFGGIYHNEEMIGFVTDTIFSVRGFSVNNGIQTFLPEEYRNDQMFMLSLKYMTNRILEMNGLPTYVVGQLKNNVKGNFDVEDIGYRNIWNVYRVK